MRKLFNKILGRSAHEILPSVEAVQAMSTAENKLVEAQKTLQKATKVANTLQTQRETNHFRERYLLALKGTTTP